MQCKPLAPSEAVRHVKTETLSQPDNPSFSQVHPSADEELLEPTEEATSERTFMHCKPLAPSEAVRQAHTIEGAPTSAARVLYGNEAFYIFFRLHHYIYDRYDML
jgi:hypothetical protein